jgi:hypothetical protein
MGNSPDVGSILPEHDASYTIDLAIVTTKGDIP